MRYMLDTNLAIYPRPRVATQHIIDPAHTIPAPCQNANGKGVLSIMADKNAENTGIKYEVPASTVILPCNIPTFHAA